MLIICHLLGGTKRFNELHRLLAGISRGTLTFELRQLQRDGIVDRTQYSTIPPTVEYRLTVSGQELKPILVALDEWSKLVPRRTKTRPNRRNSFDTHWTLSISTQSKALMADGSRTSRLELRVNAVPVRVRRALGQYVQLETSVGVPDTLSEFP